MSELICPVADCDARVEVSEEDADASLSDLVEHFAARHRVYDQQQQMGLLAKASVTA